MAVQLGIVLKALELEQHTAEFKWLADELAGKLFEADGRGLVKFDRTIGTRLYGYALILHQAVLIILC